MLLSASYEELSRLIREKSGQAIDIQYKDVDTLTLGYDATISLPIIGKPISHRISADVRVVEFAPPRAVLQIEAGAAGNMAMGFAAQRLLDRLPAGLVESFSGGRAELNLYAIPQLKTLFERFHVNALDFYENSLSIDASF